MKKKLACRKDITYPSPFNVVEGELYENSDGVLVRRWLGFDGQQALARYLEGKSRVVRKSDVPEEFMFMNDTL